MANWYTDHPVVSTVLWLMGSPPESVETNDDNPKISSKSRTLSWKDEHDGPIAEYLGSPKSTASKKKEYVQKEGGALKKSQKDEDVQLSRKQSLGALPRNDSDVEKINGESSGVEDELDTTSPQWGWYVSTTPPQEMYGQRSR